MTDAPKPPRAPGYYWVKINPGNAPTLLSWAGGDWWQDGRPVPIVWAVGDRVPPPVDEYHVTPEWKAAGMRVVGRDADA